ncbi:hypothetical protein CLOSTMETH_03710 [[Clostridium] methylpentosum DSM 5476]|uniref:Uncharacterized protein n=1 Tax=[Clostridium] methylpentosum DSM 5476 TaxID=537013 RepID=C0EIL5_9FIRM|nr:hypothetical protein CLOSTMETH_03710 [[Clostridium] methylpentosum DSM 5476]
MRYSSRADVAETEGWAFTLEFLWVSEMVGICRQLLLKRRSIHFSNIFLQI